MRDYFISPIEDPDYLTLLDLICFKRVALKMKKYKSLQKYCLVARTNDTKTAIGFVCGEITKMDSCIIWCGEVQKEYQNRGVFSALLEEMEKLCDDKAIIFFNHISLDDFYKKRGYMLGDQMHVHMKQKGIDLATLSELVEKS